MSIAVGDLDLAHALVLAITVAPLIDDVRVLALVEHLLQRTVCPLSHMSIAFGALDFVLAFFSGLVLDPASVLAPAPALDPAPDVPTALVPSAASAAVAFAILTFGFLEWIDAA